MSKASDEKAAAEAQAEADKVAAILAANEGQAEGDGANESTPDAADGSEATDGAEAASSEEAPEPVAADATDEDGRPGGGSWAPVGAPVYCSVCGRTLGVEVTEVSGGFNAVTGQPNPSRRREVRACSQLFHDRLESFDGGDFSPVK